MTKSLGGLRLAAYMDVNACANDNLCVDRLQSQKMLDVLRQQNQNKYRTISVVQQLIQVLSERSCMKENHTVVGQKLLLWKLPCGRRLKKISSCEKSFTLSCTLLAVKTLTQSLNL
jgi:hypothetical protein